jgi:phosphoribosylanthranilate isomerase
MEIKVCGITNNMNLREIALLKPDFMGFIFHESSPRDITSKIGQLQLSSIPPAVKKVAVMVDQPFEKARSIILKYGFEAVQLHGEEDPGYCSRLMQDCKVIKAFRIKEGLPPDLPEYEGHCHYFLFDAKGQFPGGNGIKFNHEILKNYTLATPFILSGGIGDYDLPYLLSVDLAGMAGIDLNSRFELSPGYKSVSSLRVFIRRIRSHETSLSLRQKGINSQTENFDN